MLYALRETVLDGQGAFLYRYAEREIQSLLKEERVR